MFISGILDRKNIEASSLADLRDIVLQDVVDDGHADARLSQPDEFSEALKASNAPDDSVVYLDHH
jgi:hypothetical protein